MKYLLLASIILLPFQLIAQTGDVEETAVIEISPNFPAPNELVAAKVRSSYYENLDRSNIIWSVDGVEKKRGVGETNFQFQAPANGQTGRVSVTVQKDNGFTYTGSKTIRPGSLDLIYEANTYTPPFYKGRSLFTHQSTITIAAVANFIEGGVRVPKNRIVYTWEKDFERIDGASGGGKDSVQIQGRLIQRPFTVTVTAQSLNSDLKAKKTILVNPIDPTVVLYENNPVYGSIFEKALTGEFNFDREEVGITAVPYFFSANDRNSSALQYSWYENGKKIGNETFGSFINYLNPNKEKSGVSKIRVEVDHLENILQENSTSFQVNVLGNAQSDTIETNENTAF